jgi:hypothetical protein
LRAPLGVLGALLALGACAGAVRGLGASPEAARQAAGELAASLAARFGPTERDPGFEVVRPILAQYALVPSRIFDAPGLWTASWRDVREIGFQGERVGGRYRMSVHGRPPEPRTPGEYRGEWRLERLKENEYEWMAREELAVGRASPGDLSTALTATFRAIESAGSGDLAARIRADLPRTAAALGRLVTLEEVQVRHEPGAARLTFAASLDPDGIRGFAPLYAHYLDDVVMPTRLTAVAFDETGARWWEASFLDGRVTLHIRVHDGDLAPLAGRPHPIPGRLHVRMAGSSKTGFLRSGFHDLEAGVELTSSPDEKAFSARFGTPPDWDLPFLVPLLLRSALQRPFQGGGALLSFGVESHRDGSTRLTRTYRVAVRENWIVRWLGSYAAGAVDTYRRGEAEADRFNAEALLALREDLMSLAGGS